METAKFQRKPRPGDKIKVYLENSKVCYGIADSVYVNKLNREIVRVRIVNQIFSIAECKFFLKESVVKFVR